MTVPQSDPIDPTDYPPGDLTDPYADVPVPEYEDLPEDEAYALSAASPDSAPASDGLPGRPLTPEHLSYLDREGIRAEYASELADAGLLRSVALGDTLPEGFDWLPDEARTGILFPWVMAHETVWQLRPDTPPLDPKDGRPRKYLFAPKAAASYNLLHRARPGHDDLVVISEGTKQPMAVVSALSSQSAADSRIVDATVVGIPGVYGWSKGRVITPGLVDLCRGKKVVIIPDRDARTNRSVYDALDDLKASLGCAKSVEFVWLPEMGGDRAGIDDQLKDVAVERRRVVVEDLLLATHPKPAKRRPSEKSGMGSTTFEAWDPMTGRLRVADLAQHLIERHHWALTAESGELARYKDGVYVIDSTQLLLESDLIRIMGNTYETKHKNNVLSALRGLSATRARIPMRPSEPLMCVANGLVDLRTLELHPHTPNFMTMRKVPLRWDPAATAERWVEWGTHQMGAEQLAVFEEGAAQMLDPSRTPTKGIYLFGPSRTGKSTLCRVCEGFAPEEQVSAVQLQSLSDDQFAAADLYGMVLNVAADMPKSHIENPSLFKSMLGDDKIRGNKKYGPTFKFRNQALFVFSCNTIATVSEQSEAYFDRILPVGMVRSYLGKTDTRIEAGILEELPGILVRLARAWQAQYLRASVDPATRWSSVPDAVTARFRADSDRVARFLNACCTIGVTAPSATAPAGVPTIGTVNAPKTPVGMGSNGPATPGQLHEAFNIWAEQEGLAKIGRKTLIERIRKTPGVRDVRVGPASVRALNVEVKDPGEWIDETSDNELIAALFGADAVPSQPIETLIDGTVEVVVDEADTAAAPPPASAPSQPGGLLERAIALVRQSARSASMGLWVALYEMESGDLNRRKFSENLAAVHTIAPQLTVADASVALGIAPEAALPLLRLVGNRLREQGAGTAGDMRMLEIARVRRPDGTLTVLDPTGYITPDTKKAVVAAAQPVDAAFLILNSPTSGAGVALPDKENAA
ncbi:DNA primase family protein [Mycobacteroides abscessus]|uniref:DNA primase family protein n=1 Tax=Mycobacteroides abscessus TaxID=36809 RepID=UPI0019D0AE79|nr:DNA primase family protein [Mycobacteroides abscessus]MBN7296580.1 hypothetical protein [Mycobacteroides abscessus subsp. abscessus]